MPLLFLFQFQNQWRKLPDDTFEPVFTKKSVTPKKTRQKEGGDVQILGKRKRTAQKETSRSSSEPEADVRIEHDTLAISSGINFSVSLEDEVIFKPPTKQIEQVKTL